MGERLLCTQEVSGSIPLCSTNTAKAVQNVRRKDISPMPPPEIPEKATEYDAQRRNQSHGHLFFCIVTYAQGPPDLVTGILTTGTVVSGKSYCWRTAETLDSTPSLALGDEPGDFPLCAYIRMQSIPEKMRD